MKNLRGTAAALAAVAFTAAACADLTQSSPDLAPTAAEREAGLASAAVAALVTDRAEPYQLFIPDATRADASAVVEITRRGSTERYRFVRAAEEWRVAQHLGTTTEAGVPDGVLLDRISTIGSDSVIGVPVIGRAAFAYADGTWPDTVYLQPLNYVSGSYRRWTQSGQVVTGFYEGAKNFTQVAFTGAAQPRWFTADSVFTVTQRNKWAYGDGNGEQGQCTPSPYTTPCYPPAPRAGFRYVDAYYTISVERRVPTTVAISPNTTIRMAPGGTAQLSATVKDQYAQTFASPVTWTSSNTAVATVSSTGQVSVVGMGSATVTATAGTASASVAVSGEHVLTMSGPSFAYNQYATITASMAPSGSYHYTWTEELCYPNLLTCSTKTQLPSGQDVTSTQVYVSKYDDNAIVKVVVRQTAGGAILATKGWMVDGAGEPIPGSGGGTCTGRICP